MSFPESLLFAVIIDMQNLFQEFFRLVIIINTDFKGSTFIYFTQYRTVNGQ